MASISDGILAPQNTHFLRNCRVKFQITQVHNKVNLIKTFLYIDYNCSLYMKKGHLSQCFEEDDNQVTDSPVYQNDVM